MKDAHAHPDSPVSAEQLQQGASYTDGESRLVTVNDGSKECLAMLVTERMIDRISHIRQQSLKVSMKKKLVDAAKREVLDIEINIEGIEARIEYLKDNDPAEQKEAQVELEQLRSKLPEAELRRDMLREDFEPIDGWLRDDMDDTLETFELVFGAADLLDPLEPQDDGEQSMADEIAKQYQLYREQLSRETENTETTPLTPDELPRQAACDELQRSYFAVTRAQAKFDDRDRNYDRQIAEFKELEVAGKLDHARTDFGCRVMQHKQQLTQDLICAEEDYKNARVQANVHKVPFPERPETELSAGADRDDDGYQESQEAWVIAEVDRGRIERRVSRVPDTQDEPSPEDKRAEAYGP